MSFGNPLAFIGLISVLAIIAMYLLKQKYREQVIPSLFLWKQALAVTESRKPWQKLRKNLLLFLQLLAAVLLTLALAKPFISGETTGSDMIIVIDASMSMQTIDTDSPRSRFETAKAEANKLIDSMQPGQRAAIVLMSGEPSIASSLTDDKKLLTDKVNSLDVSFSAADGEYTNELIKTLHNTDGIEVDKRVVIISDKLMETEQAAIGSLSHIIVGNSADNMAITLLSHTIDEKSGSINVLTKVKNFGGNTAVNSIALYADEELFDIKEITLAAGEEKEIFFAGLSEDYVMLQAELSEDDCLTADNAMYDVVYGQRTKPAIIYTDRNVFLENAFSLIPNVELIKGDLNDIDNTSGGYYLYIYDGVLPSELPADGHILIFNPPDGNTLIDSGMEWEVSDSAKINKSSLTRLDLTSYIQDFSFDVLKSKEIISPEWAEDIITSDNKALVYAGESNGRKTAVFGFDLHNSDLPLKKEFPIFIYNLCDWLIPSQTVFDSTGTAVTINGNVFFEPDPGAEGLSVILPDNGEWAGGRKISYNAPFTNLIFTDTQTPGFYTLEQTIEGQAVYEPFAVNIDSYSGESELLMEYESGTYNESGTAGEASVFTEKNIGKYFIILLLILFAVEWFIYIRQAGKISRFKKVFYSSVRIAFFILVILSLFDISVKKLSYEAATVFAVDLSDSTGENGKETALDFVRDALKNKSENDLTGAVCFGKTSLVERAPDAGSEFLDFYSHIDGSFTNISQALLLSRSILPEESRKRITLISDGLENIDSAIASARVLNDNNVVVDVFPINDNIPEFEAQLSGIKIPKYLNQNVKYDIEVEVYSVSENICNILLYKGNDLAFRQEVNLRKGTNKFVFTDISDVFGAIVYRAEIQPAGDTYHQNNVMYAYTYVEDIPHILVIGSNGSADEAAKILEASRVSVKKTQPQAVPNTVDGLSAYDGIILCDIAYGDLPEGFANALEAYAKSTGGGVLVTGGENSFALGGYDNTPLETLLPVDMELKDKDNSPNLGMIVVMDRSGSMTASEYGLSRISLAKEAVIRAVDALDDDDKFGMLTFDSGFEWTVNFAGVDGNQEEIKERIAGVSAMGGTSILPALTEAFSQIKDADTKYKHIILLTDGEAEKNGYDLLIQQMSEKGVTLSCIAVGSGSDTVLLKMLANRGGGRYYYTDAFSDLPKIFTKETTLAGKAYLNNRYFYPVNTSASPIMSGISEISVLGGYISTTPKDRADIVLSSDEDEPVLAVWQYGLGRTAAFTSDMNGLWSAEWLSIGNSGSGSGSGTGTGVDIFKNTVSWILRKQMFADASLTAEIVGDKTEFILTMPYENEISSVQCSLTDSSGNSLEIAFSSVAPGVYKGIANENRQGAYIANLDINKGEKTDTMILGVCIPYSNEYDVKQFESGLSLLRNIAEITGGSILGSPADVFGNILPNVYGAVHITEALLIIALLILLFDVFIRRFTFVSEKLEKLFNRIAAIKFNTKADDILYKEVKDLKREANTKVKEINIKPSETIQESNKGSKMSDMLLQNKKKRTGG